MPTREARHHWGGQEEEGQIAIGISFSAPECGLLECGATDVEVPLVQAMGSEAPLAWATGGGASYGLSMTGHLLCGLQAAGANSVISDSRGGCGLPPLAIHEQAPPAIPVTSEVGTEEGSVTAHYLLLLTLPWECTCPATAIAKCFRHCLHLLEGYCYFPGPFN